jgi:adenylate cyclase
LTDDGPRAILARSVSIRVKIVLVVLPLIIAPLVLTGVSAMLAARESVTAVATSFLRFKAEQLATYAQGQWDLLAANGLEADPAYRQASEAAVETFARTLVRSDTELVVALGAEGSVALESSAVSPSEEELAGLRRLAADGATGWQTLRLGGVERVAHLIGFAPFRWTFFVTEQADTFFRSTNRIVVQTGAILGASLVVAAALLALFSGYLTRPLRQVADAMAEIIATSDLSRRVEVLYGDETGRLGHTFNLMSEELEKAYGQIKGYALRAAVAQAKEQKIRHIFQKYVPRTVLEQFFVNPERMLVGEDRILAVLFSDVRGFTTIAERLRPDQMVESLNQYFGRMVDVIMGRGGIVDKYIGDAIMAFFGAPERHEDDALRSATAALEMLDALGDFNRWQASKSRPLFAIGIGINYGAVTVGNIGSERKMDYTVIGDMVNLASRLEGLTKKYHEPLIVSESVKRKVDGTLACRLLDRVAVKGRSMGSGIFAVRRSVSGAEAGAWQAHEEATKLFYERRFPEAAAGFRRALELLPGDGHAKRFLAQCERLAAAPPPKGWTGIVEMTEK